MAKMTPYRRAVCVTGSYTDRNGQEKKRFAPVGTLFQYEDGGFALKLDTIPVGQGWNGFVSFYPIEEKDGAEKPADRKPAGGYAGASQGGGYAADVDDDIPY